MKSEVERRTKSLRQKSDRPVGGQKGYESTTRKMVANPDEIENVRSLCCTQCGRDLSDIEGVLEYVSQEIDLPSIRPIYRERRFYKKNCSCGYCKGKLNWSWIAQTAYLTLVFRGSGRGSKVLEDRFGDSLKNMVAVTDRHSAYFVIDFLNNQVCLAHLLRNL